MVINNDGGELASTLSIVDSMSRCTCEIVGVLSGTVASAGTMLALACDKLEVAPHTSFMIHSASGGTGGKLHETKAYMEFSDKNTREIFHAVYKGFLTEPEIKRVLDGKDMWMGRDEILERFAKMKEVK
jgi:ATP-dependent protease ClpP protease subunit